MDGVNIESNDLLQAVRDTNMLVNVSIGMWGAQRTDKESLEDLKKLKNAKGDVGTFHKKLMAGHDSELKKVCGAFRAIQTRHVELTRQWSARTYGRREGPRLLANTHVDMYLSEIAIKRKAAIAERDMFAFDIYPGLIAKAQDNLGDMADFAYPTPEQVQAAFWVEVEFEQIPLTTNPNAVGMSNDMLERLSTNIGLKYQAKIVGAQETIWADISQHVGHLVERLRALKADDKTRFFSSSVDHVRDLVKMLPGWNITNDPKVTKVIQDLQSMLVGVDAESIRDNTQVRDAVHNHAQSIMDQLDTWGVK